MILGHSDFHLKFTAYHDLLVTAVICPGTDALALSVSHCAESRMLSGVAIHQCPVPGASHGELRPLQATSQNNVLLSAMCMIPSLAVGRQPLSLVDLLLENASLDMAWSNLCIVKRQVAGQMPDACVLHHPGYLQLPALTLGRGYVQPAFHDQAYQTGSDSCCILSAQSDPA